MKGCLGCVGRSALLVLAAVAAVTLAGSGMVFPVVAAVIAGFCIAFTLRFVFVGTDTLT